MFYGFESREGGGVVRERYIVTCVVWYQLLGFLYVSGRFGGVGERRWLSVDLWEGVVLTFERDWDCSIENVEMQDSLVRCLYSVWYCVWYWVWYCVCSLLGLTGGVASWLVGVLKKHVFVLSINEAYYEALGSIRFNVG